jgi:hypothetical protein
MNETAAAVLFRRRHPEGFWKKLHGGKFQRDLPDILWGYRGGVQFLEFKIIDKDILPWSKCRLGQHLTMIQMMKEGMDVKYICYSKEYRSFFIIPPDQVYEGGSTKLNPKALVE